MTPTPVPSKAASSPRKRSRPDGDDKLPSSAPEIAKDQEVPSAKKRRLKTDSTDSSDASSVEDVEMHQVERDGGEDEAKSTGNNAGGEGQASVPGLVGSANSTPSVQPVPPAPPMTFAPPRFAYNPGADMTLTKQQEEAASAVQAEVESILRQQIPSLPELPAQAAKLASSSASGSGHSPPGVGTAKRQSPSRMAFYGNLSLVQRMVATAFIGLALILALFGHVPRRHMQGGGDGTAAFNPLSPLARRAFSSLTASSRPSSVAQSHETPMLPTSIISSLESLLSQSEPERRHHPHVRPPRRTPRTAIQRLTRMAEPGGIDGSGAETSYDDAELSDVTLRQFLTHPDGFHLAMAPAFFGFYAYFGALTALNEDVLPRTGDGYDPTTAVLPVQYPDPNLGPDAAEAEVLLKSVAGASAGAMAAILLSAGADPRRAADFASSFQLGDFADFPGLGAAMKGNKFERIMLDHLEGVVKARSRPCRLEHAVVPVAVTGFDLLTLRGKVLSRGCMARAARASATFPGLFQPVSWWETEDDDESEGGEGGLLPKHLLIDGGVTDSLGLEGLSVLSPETEKRVLNLVVGGFGTERPPGPSGMPPGVKATEVASVSIINTPRCGPWAMDNGPRAVEAARRAVATVLDTPMHKGKEEGHYELHIDASAFAT